MAETAPSGFTGSGTAKPVAPAATAPASSIAASTHPAVVASNVVVAHHPIIKLGIVCFALWLLAGKIEVMWANHETKVFDAKNAALQAQVNTNQQLAAQASADAAQYANLEAQYEALKIQTQAQIAALKAQTQKQQQEDATMQPDQLAAHWSTIIKVNDSVHPIPSGGYTVTQSGAVATTQALDSIPELQGEVASAEKLIAEGNAASAAQGKEISDLNAQVAGLQKQNADEVTTCNTEVGKVKADDAVKLHNARKHAFLGGAGSMAAVFTVIKILLIVK